ncbi:hypothetical protein GCM10011611_05250 [Aliidongia dinghuensis]|uniref:Uncharacterized protein n=1 Tax=Aliidongia dinghuensis TaxID=1867774 RepID=A0A8J3E0K1_9PROT|nr:hypothetical protein [Aliidongia dinghuensis]GGF02739.1 hypothetical protein GCM10011611_05250 [Aliidongia dinghuensis]
MTAAPSLVEQAVAHLNARRYAEAATLFLAAVNAVPTDDEAWRGLAVALALQGRLGDLIGLADYRERRRGDGFLFCHEALGLLLTYRLHGHLRALDDALPMASVYKPPALYQAACADLLDGAEDAAFARLGRFKELVRAGAGQLPIGADSHFNIAYRQGTLIEDVDFVAGLAEPAAVAARLPATVRELDAGAGGRPYVLATACDRHYFERFAPGFVRSAAAQMPGAALHFHVMAADEASRSLFRALTAEAPGLALNLSTEPDSALRSGAYYASARFLVGPDLLRHYRRPVVLLDADVGFLQPLDPLVAAAAGYDFTCFRHDGAGPCSRYPAVLGVCDPGAGGQAFLERVRLFVLAKLEIEWPFNWMLDQAALASVIRWVRKTRGETGVGILNELVGTHFQPWLRSVGGDEKAALIRAASGQ